MENLRIHVATWNVACKPPEASLNLDKLLGLENPDSPVPDVYIIGLQEVKAQVQNIVLDALFDDPWAKLFKIKLGGKGFVKVKTVRLQGMVLSLFVPKEKLLTVRDLSWEVVRTGLGGFWGNKGAVGLRLSIKGVSLCIINSHLAPHDHNLLARVADYNTIVQHMRFPKRLPTEMIFFHDYVVWLGDHNFRIDESVSHEQVLSKIKCGEVDWLLERDQLKTVMRNGNAFSELIEPDLRFYPTFKFLFNSSDYDSKRRPAWTDRVLYRVTENAYENMRLGVETEKYTSLPEYTQSDHKPVICQLSIRAMSQYHDRVVKFRIIDEWAIDTEKKVVLEIGDDITVNDFDWIGIYKANYTALDEYESFMYVTTPPIDDTDGEQRPSANASLKNRELTILFPDSMFRVSGEYCLLYITDDWGSVLGASNTFKARSSTNSPCQLTGF